MRAFLALLIFLCPSAPSPAATGECGERSALVAHLEARFGERVVAQGLTATGAMMELLEAEDGGTWTMILSYPTGISCVFAAGELWTPHGHAARERET